MKKQKRPPYTLPPTPAAKITSYRYILKNGQMIGAPMSENEAFRRLQFMRSEISGIEIIPVEEIELQRGMNLMVLMGGAT